MKAEWENYGDVDFMKYGGCLIKKTRHPNCYHVLSLTPDIYDYKGKYKNPMIVALCFVDVAAWKEDYPVVNKYSGYEHDYVPKTEEEQMSYCVDLINYYGIQEFEPDFPEETGCGCYALNYMEKWIVGKTIAQRFMKECRVPYKYRH